MPDIRAFKALRYRTENLPSNDISSLIAPPYDVLDADDKAALLAKSEHNIVAVDLPFLPPKSAGPDEVYAQAAQLLQKWIAAGVIGPDATPSIYVYHQQYTHAGRSYTRKMFFARMQLEEFGAGTVFPHEKTFGGPKEDRLKLMKASRCQLSAVFGLYTDPSQSIAALLKVNESRPDVTARMDGVTNHLWLLQDPATIEALRARMRTLPVYIADGHHRYGTALIYRKQLAEKGPLPEEHPAHFILIGLCAMEDPGCVILPTHRIISGFGAVTAPRIVDALKAGVELRPANVKGSAPETWLPASAADDIAVYVAEGEQLHLGRFTKRSALEQLAADRTPPYRQLDLAYLHDYLLNELLTRQLLDGTPPTIQYSHSADEAVRIAREVRGIAFITKPCTMAQLRAVSDAGDLMPQKSTFFYPKLATGMVVNPLE